MDPCEFQSSAVLSIASTGFLRSCGWHIPPSCWPLNAFLFPVDRRKPLRPTERQARKQRNKNCVRVGKAGYVHILSNLSTLHLTWGITHLDVADQFPFGETVFDLWRRCSKRLAKELASRGIYCLYILIEIRHSKRARIQSNLLFNSALKSKLQHYLLCARNTTLSRSISRARSKYRSGQWRDLRVVTAGIIQ